MRWSSTRDVRKLLHDGAEGGEEAHVEHAVGLVEDDGCGAGQVDQAAIDIVTEAARGGDDHFGAGLDVAELALLAQAADDVGGMDVHAVDELAEGLVDLDAKFAGGAADEDLDGLGAGSGEMGWPGRAPG
jgi:hypothetical protein